MKTHFLSSLPENFDFQAENDVPFIIFPTRLSPRNNVGAGHNLPLVDGNIDFSHLEIYMVDENGSLHFCQTTPDEAAQWMAKHGLKELYENYLNRLTKARKPFAGLSMDRPRVMGIINLTPDSFYADSRVAPVSAIDVALRMVDEGADIIDIGGESTRPNSYPTSIQEEFDRVLPIVERLKDCGAVISVDTRRTSLMAAVIQGGATVINDVNGLRDEGAVNLIAQNPQVSAVLMHSVGTPTTMQNSPFYFNTRYQIFCYLTERVNVCEQEGIARERLAVDPGFGFGKSTKHNMDILRHIGVFHGIGCAVLSGLSRKSFIGDLTYENKVSARLPATIAATVIAQSQAVQLHRVHDVKQVKQALLFHHRLMND
mgnify:CR=1 FL=1